MNGDQQYTEILAAINRLELSQARIFQNYEDYKEARKDIPKDIQELKDRTAKCNLECDHHTAETKNYFKKTDFLMTWYGRGAALIFAVTALNMALSLLNKLDIQYTFRP